MDRQDAAGVRAGTPTTPRPRATGWASTPSSSRWSRSTRPTTRRPTSATPSSGPSGRRDGFTFNIKAFSLLTQHPTKVVGHLQGAAPGDGEGQRLPQGLRAGGRRRHLGPVPVRAAAARGRGQARRLALPVPAVVPDRPGQQVLHPRVQAPSRGARHAHLRGVPQQDLDERGATRPRRSTSSRSYGLPYVVVDMPQGYPSSIPPVVAATSSDLAVVRFHGHSDKWNSRDIYERFGYLYSDAGARASGRPRCATWPRRPRRPTCCSTTATATTPSSTPARWPTCSTFPDAVVCRGSRQFQAATGRAVHHGGHGGTGWSGRELRCSVSCHTGLLWVLRRSVGTRTESLSPHWTRPSTRRRSVVDGGHRERDGLGEVGAVDLQAVAAGGLDRGSRRGSCWGRGRRR